MSSLVFAWIITYVVCMADNRLDEDEAILAEATAETSFRLSLAVRVRMEDKQVLAGVIDTIEQWKHVLATCPEKYPPSTTRSVAKC